MKKKLFVVNGAHYISSGYGVYGKELLTRLHNSGKYEVAELACYCPENSNKIQDCPWKVYPNNPNINDEQKIKLYQTQKVNEFGNWRFNRCLLDFKPHIVFDVRDYWMCTYQESTPYRKHFHWIIMPTCDSAPQKTEWYYTYANADVVVPYTQWAKDTLTKGGAGKLNIFPKIVNAGINPDEFYPLENKKEHQIKHFGRDVNVVGFVMRNQRRKLMPDLMRAFRKYLDRLKSENDPMADNTILYFHTSYPEEQGWDIPSLLLEFQLLDKVYFTYKCNKCGKWSANKYNGPLMDCHNCNTKNSNIFITTSNGLNNEQLNEVYNLFDVYIQYAIAEGFGMVQVEAASAGIPIASVDYSAMSEIVRNVGGTPIPIQKTFRELETNADRVYPDNDFTTQFLYDFFKKDYNERRRLGKIAREKCVSMYTWDHTFKVWDEVFDTIDVTKKVAWDDPTIFKTNHQNMKVPANLSPREFVEYIVINVINDPFLLKTSNIQCLIRDMTQKIMAKKGKIGSFYYKEAIDILEGIMNDKILHEEVRHHPERLLPENYLTCQNPKKS